MLNLASRTILLLIVISSVVMAEIPQMINFQGQLLDVESNPVDEIQLIKFIIYDAETGGTILWNSQFQTVDVSNGLFSVELGAPPMDPLPDNLFSGDTIRYLGITVGTDLEISPRLRITSSSYAYHSLRADTSGYSGNADLLDGLDGADFSLAAHNHDGLYSPLAHNHDGSYASVSHTHSYASLSHTHDGSDITTGQISYYRFDAYNNLLALGRLDNNSSTDLLNRSQLDSRFAPYNVTSAYITNDAGLASSVKSDGISLNSTLKTVATSSITFPTSGYAVIIAESVFNNVDAGYITSVVYYNGASLPQWYWEAGDTEGFYDQHQTRVLTQAVSAGSYSYELRLATHGSTSSYIDDAKLIIIFFPTLYGSLATPTSPGEGTDNLLLEASNSVNSVSSPSEIVTNEKLMERLLKLEMEIQNLKNGQ